MKWNREETSAFIKDRSKSSVDGNVNKSLDTKSLSRVERRTIERYANRVLKVVVARLDFHTEAVRCQIESGPRQCRHEIKEEVIVGEMQSFVGRMRWSNEARATWRSRNLTCFCKDTKSLNGRTLSAKMMPTGKELLTFGGRHTA